MSGTRLVPEHSWRRGVILEAAALTSDDGGENTEYDRALGELVGRLLGVDSDAEPKDVVIAVLKGLK